MSYIPEDITFHAYSYDVKLDWEVYLRRRPIGELVCQNCQDTDTTDVMIS
jgi:hypothetical protein